MGKATGVAMMDMQPSYRTTLNELLDRHNLTEAQTIVFAAIFHAAEMDLPCPKGEELNDLLGYSSDSASRFTMQRLEAMGLIKLERFQRFRKVLVVATQKWTARDPAQHADRPHIPRGMRSRGGAPTDRKPYKSRNKL